MLEIRRHVVVLVAGLLALGTACSSSKPAVAPASSTPARDPNDPELAYERYTLANGLTVLLHKDARLPVVTVNLWYRVGSMHEVPGRTGFAHLFEHLMFQGSRHVADDEHFALLEQAGASDVNGTTDYDRTNYYASLPREQLPLALWLESDRMGFLLDTLDAHKLESQRAVVKNERRQSYDGAPYGLAALKLHEGLFPPGHPYHHPPIGSMADLDAATLDDVRAFFKKYYSPANATLTLAGDFDPAEAKALIEQAFGRIKGEPRPPSPAVATPPLTKEIRQELDEPVAPLARVAFAYLTPAVFAPGDAEMDVLSDVLGTGKGSRLYRALVEKAQVAQQVSAGQNSLGLASTFVVEAIVAPGHTVEEVEQALDAVIDDLATVGPLPQETRRARELIELGLLRSLEHVGNRAEWLQTFELYRGDPGFLDEHLATYRAVDANAVREAVRKYLRKDARLVQISRPKKNGGLTAAAGDVEPPEAPDRQKLPPAEPWRARPPAPLPASVPSLPVPEKAVLDNGLTVMAVKQGDLPLVGWMLVTRAGAARDPLDKRGRAFLAAQMLTEGMEGTGAAAQSDAFAELGTQVASSAGVEASSVSAVVHRRDAAAGLGLLVRVVRAPTMDPDAFNRLKTRALTGLDQRLHDPMGVAMHLVARLGVGLEHPYGNPRDGTPDGLRNVTLDDVKTAASESWTARNMALIAVGDIGLEDALKMAKAHFAGVEPGVAFPLTQPPAGRVPAGEVLAVELPGAPQTAVVVALPGLSVDDKDHPALSLLNATLGGNFSSRLNLNLREGKGITYGAFSMAQAYKNGGLFAAVAPVQADATPIGVTEMLKELRGLKERPITEPELELARQSATRGLPAEFEGVVETAASVARLFALDLPLDYFARLPARLEAVALTDVARVGGRLLKPEAMQALLVGDRSAVERASGAGMKLKWVDTQGRPIASPAAPPEQEEGKDKGKRQRDRE